MISCPVVSWLMLMQRDPIYHEKPSTSKDFSLNRDGSASNSIQMNLNNTTYIDILIHVME